MSSSRGKRLRGTPCRQLYRTGERDVAGRLVGREFRWLDKKRQAVVHQVRRELRTHGYGPYHPAR